jgi:hypothetical protein
VCSSHTDQQGMRQPLDGFSKDEADANNQARCILTAKA